MGNKKAKTVNFNGERFMQALKYRGLSIRKIGELDSGLGWSDKTLRRAKNTGQISKELLDALAVFLDVDPGFLGGKYDALCDAIERERGNHELAEAIRAQIKPERFPYHLSQNHETMYDRYLDYLLALHNISNSQLKELPEEERLNFELEVDRAITPIIAKYFELDSMGRRGHPDLGVVEAMIQNAMPEPLTAEKFNLRLDTLENTIEREK